jgi:hypothetical protein
MPETRALWWIAMIAQLFQSYLSVIGGRFHDLTFSRREQWPRLEALGTFRLRLVTLAKTLSAQLAAGIQLHRKGAWKCRKKSLHGEVARGELAQAAPVK